MRRNLLLGLVLALLSATPIMGEPAFPTRPIHRDDAPQRLCDLKEQRAEKYWPLLRVSVKVSVQGSSGSGTICHYDGSDGWAYVVSCGHLWGGNRGYEPNNPSKAKVLVWYKEGPRLHSPASYDAEVLFWSNSRGKDVSLLRFKPDWTPSYAPISIELSPKPGDVLNSMGCDGGREVARYEVVVKSASGVDLVTGLNSPRPGRSGGGLVTDDCRLVGVCWGTSEPSSGNGVGFFTPLSAIAKVFDENGHSWLLRSGFMALDIPIVDRDRPKAAYDRYFIPTPRP